MQNKPIIFWVSVSCPWRNSGSGEHSRTDLGGLLSVAPAAVDKTREQRFHWKLWAAGQDGPVQRGPLPNRGPYGPQRPSFLSRGKPCPEALRSATAAQRACAALAHKHKAPAARRPDGRWWGDDDGDAGPSCMWHRGQFLHSRPVQVKATRRKVHGTERWRRLDTVVPLSSEELRGALTSTTPQKRFGD